MSADDEFIDDQPPIGVLTPDARESLAAALAATPEDHPDYHKLRAASARERAEHNCPFAPDSAAHAFYVSGYMEGRLGEMFKREAELERQLADMTEDRDGWKDLADARKPKTCLQLKP